MKLLFLPLLLSLVGLLSPNYALAQLNCSLILPNGTTRSFERGESFGSFIVAEYCGASEVEEFPCFCEPLLGTDSVSCPYCGFENSDGAMGCVVDGMTAVLPDAMGDQRCTCGFSEGAGDPIFSNCVPVQEEPVAPIGLLNPSAPTVSLAPVAPPVSAQCLIQIRASPERCEPLVAKTTEECDCYDFCGETVVGCKEFGEGGGVINPCEDQGGFQGAVFGCTKAAPNTMAPTTMTVAPVVTTMAPTTFAPFTLAPMFTSVAPVTQAPVTQAPVTQAPVVVEPSTEAPSTSVPGAETPVTVSPATQAPVTQGSATGAPAVGTDTPATANLTDAPITASATPVESPGNTTTAPGTPAPITVAPVTMAPSSNNITLAPSTKAPTTPAPTPITAAPAPFDGEQRCFVKVNFSAEKCQQLLAAVTEECDCYDFCGQELVSCKDFRETVGGGINAPCRDQGGFAAAVFGCSNKEDTNAPTPAPSGSTITTISATSGAVVMGLSLYYLAVA